MLHGLAAVVGLVSRPAPSVAVVGTGWSGLYAIKYLREEGLNVVAFERERTSGGIWGLAEAQHVSASSSKTYLHASDYSFDSDDDFPTAAEVQEHLRGYAAHHGLAESIQYGTRVDHAAFDSAKRKWRLSVSTAAGSGSEALEVDKLVLTQGLCGTPMVPTDLAAQFAAAGVPHMHMADFRKDALPEWAQRGAKHACLVIGGGESATDIAASLADRSQSARVVLSLRTGRWFLPKMKPPLGAIPADLASRRTFTLMSSPPFQRLFDSYLRQHLGVGGHGFTPWAPSPRVSSWSCFLNKRSDAVVEHARRGRIIPAGAVSAVTRHPDGGANVHFEKLPAPVHIGGVVFATGFKRCPELASAAGLDNPSHSLHHTFPANDAEAYGTVAYIGAARPNLGSIPSLAEYSSAWVSRVFSGHVQLPSIDRARVAIRQQHDERLAAFPEDGARLATLVHTARYADRILKQLGFRSVLSGLPPIDLLRIYGPVDGTRAWWTLLTAPWSARELDVLLRPGSSGRQTLEDIRSDNRIRKTRDPDVFLKRLLSSQLKPPQLQLSTPRAALHAANKATKWLVTVAQMGALLFYRPPAAPAVSSLVVIGTVLSAFLSKALKALFKQARPSGAALSDPGMPSSHALASSFAAAAWALHFRTVSCTLLLGLSATLVCALRVLTGYHTLGQVSVGAILGGALAAVWMALGTSLMATVPPKGLPWIAAVAFIFVAISPAAQPTGRAGLTAQPSGVS